jgi:hypothetical protein
LFTAVASRPPTERGRGTLGRKWHQRPVRQFGLAYWAQTSTYLMKSSGSCDLAQPLTNRHTPRWFQTPHGGP